MTLAEKIAKLKELEERAVERGRWPDDADLVAYLRDNAVEIIEELQAENERLRKRIGGFIDGERVGPND